MSNYILHRAESRGHANHGWLNAWHSFSFSGYYDPERMHFGVLRVLNDDTVDPGMGFGMHPHDNMEIITIPLKGSLQHKDSMGNGTIITAGEIQVMSAGMGILHSEMNPDHENPVNLLQIWVFPDKQDVQPRYQQIKLDQADKKNNLRQILSPVPQDNAVWIHQQAWFYLGNFDAIKKFLYVPKKNDHGVYLFIISGSFEANGHVLKSRDGLGIWNTEEIIIQSLQPNSEILLMDVPLTINK